MGGKSKKQLKIMATGLSGDIGRHIKIQNISDFGVRLENTQEVVTRIYESKPNQILHLAGVVGNAIVKSDLENSYKINVEATRNLGLIALESGVSRFTFVSSGHVYGVTEEPAREDSIPNPQTFYAEQKLLAESHLQDIFKDDPTKLTIVRVFSVLGFGMKPHTLGGAVENLLLSKSALVIPNSQDVRDFLSPVQVGSLLERIVNYKSSLPRVLNLGSGKRSTIKEGVQALLETKSFAINPNIFLPGFSEMPKNFGNVDKLRDLLI